MNRKALTAAVLLAFIATRGLTQEHQHGDSEKLGEIYFATSCNESAHSDFNRAVALLRGLKPLDGKTLQHVADLTRSG